MRILLVTDERGTSGIPGGGINHLMYVMRPAKSLGHEVDYITADNFRFSNYNKEKMFEYLKDKIKKFNPDVINLFNNCIWGFDVFAEIDKLNIPSVLTTPDYAPVCKTRMLEKPLGDLCDGASVECKYCPNYRVGVKPDEDIVSKMKGRQVIVASDFLRDALIKGGFEPENVEMIEYGLNPKAFKPVYGGTSDEILNISRMAYEKGTDIYIKLAEENQKHNWILAGYPTMANLHNPRVNYLGEISEFDKFHLLRNCEMFVSTPRWNEPVGGTYLEAKACGKPIVTFRLGGIPQYHEGIGSVLFNFPQSEDEAKIILKDMSKAVDELHDNEDLRIKMGKEGRKQIEERNNESILIFKTLAVYDKLLGKR